MMFKKITLSLCLLFLGAICVEAQLKPHVLVFSKTVGFRHNSIETGQKKFKEWAKKSDWNVQFSEEVNDLNN